MWVKYNDSTIVAFGEALGVRVFTHQAGGYALTELGEEVLLTAQKTEELLDDLVGRASVEKAKIKGDIKLTILQP